jgi:hypothetical protein
MCSASWANHYHREAQMPRGRDEMPGEIKRVIDCIIERRSNGNAAVAITTKTRLVLKGINPDDYRADSFDNPVVLEKVKQLAKELGVAI